MQELYKMERVDIFSPVFDNEIESTIYYLTRKTTFTFDEIAIIEVFEVVDNSLRFRDIYEQEKNKEVKKLGELVNDWQEIKHALTTELLNLRTPKK